MPQAAAALRPAPLQASPHPEAQEPSLCPPEPAHSLRVLEKAPDQAAGWMAPQRQAPVWILARSRKVPCSVWSHVESSRTLRVCKVVPPLWECMTSLAGRFPPL